MERKGLIDVILSVACFGSASIFAKIAYAAGIDVFTLLTLRFSIAAALLWLACLATRTDLRLAPRDLRTVLLLGGAGYTSMSFLYFSSLQYIPVSLTVLLTYTYPAIVAVLAYFFLRERFDAGKLFALAMVTAGCALTVWVPGVKVNFFGAALAFSSAVVYSVYIVAAGRFTSHLNPRVLTLYVAGASAAVYTVYGIISGSVNLHLPAAAFAAAAGLAAIPTVLGNIFFFSALHRIGAAKTALISSIEPAYTVTLALLLFREAVTLSQMTGGALIIGAIMLLSRSSPAAAKDAASGSKMAEEITEG